MGSRSKKFATGLAIVAAFAAPVAGSAQVLTFEGILSPPGANTSPVGNFYNGGAGPNFGIVFSPNALAICLDTLAFTCPNSNVSRGGLGDPNSQGTGLFFLTGSSTFMNSLLGFGDGFSFFYTTIGAVGSFNVWSGLDGTGTLLASLALPLTPNGGCPAFPTELFCPFVAAGVAFAGTAHSVVFAGANNGIAFDDVTFGSATPGSVTPEPATIALVATGLVGVALMTRKRRAFPSKRLA